MKIIGVLFGSREVPHIIHDTWFRSIGLDTTTSYTIFELRRLFPSLSKVSHLLGYVRSIFMPKADVYVLTSLGALPAVILKKKLFGSKVVSINSDTFFTDLNKSKGLQKAYMKWLVKHVDVIISTSPWVRDIGKKYTKAVQKVVYPFCDVRKFTKVKPNYKVPHICTIGTGINTKGTDILFDAFRVYQKKFPESKLYVCGELKKIAHLEKPKNAILLGVVNPAPYLGKSSIYINASRHESFGVNIIEAMAAGLPPLVTTHCGAAALVKEVDPWLVTSLDAQEIARKAIALQKNIVKKKRLGKKAKQIALRLTKERSIKEFKKTFYSVIS